MSDTIFNIYGGNNQLAPNAKQVTQNINTNADCKAKQYTQAEDVTPLPDTINGTDDELPAEALRLTLYINKERLHDYLSQIGACQSATELARVVVDMALHEPLLDSVEIVKERFIEQILPFAVNVRKGNTVSNVRQRINDAWEKLPSNVRSSTKP